MAGLPSGEVTFLFTDVEEGSPRAWRAKIFRPARGVTTLWEQDAEAMHRTLARHDALLRTAVEAHHGHVFKTIGAAFCAGFASAPDAVQAAVAAQQALHREVPQLRVRMALHTGQAELRDGDYFGPALSRVARLLLAGHGGQILLSKATAERIQPSLPDGTRLRRLGMHRLRDLTTRELIFQLNSPGLPSHFPPLNTLDVAFRRGASRATLVWAVIVAVIVGLALMAYLQTLPDRVLPHPVVP
jgi:Adenylate and Guanylate cyclase catalytic domain